MSALSDALLAALQAVAPVCNLDIGSEADRATWRCGFTDGATDAQRAAAAGVLAGFVPPMAPPPVSGDAIIGAMSKADRAKADPLDLARIAYRDDVPASNSKLARIAKALGTTPDALRQAGTQVA